MLRPLMNQAANFTHFPLMLNLWVWSASVFFQISPLKIKILIFFFFCWKGVVPFLMKGRGWGVSISAVKMKPIEPFSSGEMRAQGQ